MSFSNLISLSLQERFLNCGNNSCCHHQEDVVTSAPKQVRELPWENLLYTTSHALAILNIKHKNYDCSGEFLNQCLGHLHLYLNVSTKETEREHGERERHETSASVSQTRAGDTAVTWHGLKPSGYYGGYL